MKKAFKSIMLIVMGVCLFLSLAPTVTNAETIENQTVKDNVLFTVTVKDEKELNDFLKELDKYNKKSQKLWENAQRQRQSQNENINNIKNGDSDNILARYYISSCTAQKSVLLGGNRAYLGAYSSFGVTWNGFSNVFDDIQQLYFYGQDSSTTISNEYITRKLIDSERTLAINGDFLVGVKTYGGNFNFHPMKTYLEMYVSGGYWWP